MFENLFLFVFLSTKSIENLEILLNIGRFSLSIEILATDITAYSYKSYIAKVLANRLRNFLDSILNPYQSSGCKTRNIHNNALNLKFILEYLTQNKMPTALISFDNGKAFIRLVHNCI